MKYIYTLEKVIFEGDTPEMLKVTRSENWEVDEVINLDNVGVSWKVTDIQEDPKEKPKK